MFLIGELWTYIRLLAFNANPGRISINIKVYYCRPCCVIRNVHLIASMSFNCTLLYLCKE